MRQMFVFLLNNVSSKVVLCSFLQQYDEQVAQGWFKPVQLKLQHHNLTNAWTSPASQAQLS